MKPATKKRLCTILVILGVVNFLAFVVISNVHGGLSLHGKMENGIYYVGNHGTFTEVSKSFYWASLYQAYSNLVTFPLGMISIHLNGQRKKAEELEEKKAQIRSWN
jgi:hypothetical protein